MDKDKFVGLWRLVASEFRRADGTITYPYGKEAVGMLVYDREGHMTVQIMRPDRPAFVSGDIRKGTPEEIQAAFDGYLGYFGAYEVNETQGSIVHNLQGSLFPNWVGQNQKRYYQFSDNRLTLKTDPLPAAGTMVTGVLVWERVV